MAAYEGILPNAETREDQMPSNLYDGVFSAHTFEILVPHNQDKLLRVGVAQNFSH